MTDTGSIFTHNKILAWTVLFVIFGFGIGIRLYDLFDHPLDFHATRQLHSMLMARGMYYQKADDIPDWQRQTAIQQWKAEGVIEPPIMEWLTTQGYHLAGGDYPWIARLLSIIFWSLGGVFLFLLARDISSFDGAVIAAAFYMFLPYAGIASRSFQPDPLMTAVIAVALWSINKWHQVRTWRWAVTAGLLGGLAIFTKAVAVFFIGGAWVGILLLGVAGEFKDNQSGSFFRNRSVGAIKLLKNPQFWVIGLLTILPYLVYHLYGVYIAGFLGSQMGLRFFPNLWIDPVWYLRWKGQISSTVRFEWFILAILGTFLLKSYAHRMMLLGIWVGYFIYGMTLSFHIATHDYYQLPLIPVVALGLAGGADMVFQNLKGSRSLIRVLVTTLILFVIVVNAWDIRVALKRMDYQAEVKFWEELGDRLGRGSAVVGITQDYGYRLAYWGWINSNNWMYTGDFTYRELAGHEFNDIEGMLEERLLGKDYFVVTMFNELDSQPQVKNYLYDNYPILEETNDYLIFDLRPGIPSGDGEIGQQEIGEGD